MHPGAVDLELVRLQERAARVHGELLGQRRGHRHLQQRGRRGGGGEGQRGGDVDAHAGIVTVDRPPPPGGNRTDAGFLPAVHLRLCATAQPERPPGVMGWGTCSSCPTSAPWHRYIALGDSFTEGLNDADPAAARRVPRLGRPARRAPRGRDRGRRRVRQPRHPRAAAAPGRRGAGARRPGGAAGPGQPGRRRQRPHASRRRPRRARRHPRGRRRPVPGGRRRRAAGHRRRHPRHADPAAGPRQDRRLQRRHLGRSPPAPVPPSSTSGAPAGCRTRGCGTPTASTSPPRGTAARRWPRRPRSGCRAGDDDWRTPLPPQPAARVPGRRRRGGRLGARLRRAVDRPAAARDVVRGRAGAKRPVPLALPRA